MSNEVDKNGKLIHKDPTKAAFVKVLEFITNTFYRTDENDEISIVLSNKSEADNFYDQQKIVLAEGLIDAFGKINLPRFLIYYHELGHHLFSQGMFKLQKTWAKLKGTPIDYNPKYDHLNNWIEDYYIEQKLIDEHQYLTDVLNCIKQLPPDYDIQALPYAFNFWYVHQGPTPALSYTDQLAFKAYVVNLLQLRQDGMTRFGHGVLSTLTMKKTRETKYIELLIEFYNWCVAKKIFNDKQQLPKLQNPNNHIDQGGQQGQGQNGQQGQPNGSGKGGTSSDHSKTVGKNLTPQEVTHITKSTPIFKDEVAAENKLIQKELLDMSQRMQVDNHTLDGLFSTKYKDSSIIQPKIILKNFFNPNRIVDQVLFRLKRHTYMNVAIYRDISGSTHGSVHTLMEHVTSKLYEDIPVDITYYLYGSGKISIVEMPYIPWLKHDSPPSAYNANPLFKQIGGGTNSDAIADVITQQLSEKWLNIIITDGDLHSLMQRDNIKELLKNVFVIAVDSEVPSDLLGISVNTRGDIENINSKLSQINVNRD